MSSNKGQSIIHDNLHVINTIYVIYDIDLLKTILVFIADVQSKDGSWA